MLSDAERKVRGLSAMKKIIQKIIYVFIGAAVICFFVLGFMAYFVSSFDISKGIMYDGLGRQLTESPFIVRFVFGEEILWAGWGWFAVDLIVFWGGVAICYGLAQWASGLQDKNE